MNESKISSDQIKNYVIIGGVVIAAIYLLPPIIKILQVPGAILDAPGKILDTLKDAVKNDPGVPMLTKDTSIPGFSTDQFKIYLDKPLYANNDNVPMRDTANSAGNISKTFNLADQVGYFYSAVNEKLGNKNKTWVWISDSPGTDASPYGFIALSDLSLNDTGIGCNCKPIRGIRKPEPYLN